MASSHSSLLTRRALRRGWRYLAREGGWGTTLVALAGTVLALQLLLLLQMGVRTAEGLLRASADVRLEIGADASPDRVQELYAALRAQRGIARVDIITKEEAYEREKERDPAMIGFLEKFGLQNPFPDSLAIRLRTLSSYEGLTRFLQDQRWAGIVDPTFLSEATRQETQIREILRTLDVMDLLSTAFLLVGGLTLLAVLVSSIHRRVLQRAEHSRLLHLLGARSGDILLPYWAESTILLIGAVLVAGFLAAGLLAAASTLLPELEQSKVFANFLGAFLPVLTVSGPALLVLQLLAAPLLAGAGVLLSARGPSR